MNLLQKARARPDQVRKVLDTARRPSAGRVALSKKSATVWRRPRPSATAAAGVVVEVDACVTRAFASAIAWPVAGAECAFHAEFRRAAGLARRARVPDGVENWQAAYTTHRRHRPPGGAPDGAARSGIGFSSWDRGWWDCS